MTWWCLCRISLGTFKFIQNSIKNFMASVGAWKVTKKAVLEWFPLCWICIWFWRFHFDWPGIKSEIRVLALSANQIAGFTWKFVLKLVHFEWFLVVDHRNTFWAAQLNSFGISFRQRHTENLLICLSIFSTHQKWIYNSIQPSKTIWNVLHICAPKAC